MPGKFNETDGLVFAESYADFENVYYCMSRSPYLLEIYTHSRPGGIPIPKMSVRVGHGLLYHICARGFTIWLWISLYLPITKFSAEYRNTGQLHTIAYHTLTCTTIWNPKVSVTERGTLRPLKHTAEKSVSLRLEKHFLGISESLVKYCTLTLRVVVHTFTWNFSFINLWATCWRLRHRGSESKKIIVYISCAKPSLPSSDAISITANLNLPYRTKFRRTKVPKI